MSVDYDTMDATAMDGSDYARPPLPRTLTFLPGETSKSFNVPIIDDSAPPEGDETFKVLLSNPTAGAVVVGPSIAAVRIIDDESARLDGHWSYQIDWPVVPIHLSLLPTGNVMFWEGAGDNTKRFDEIRLWDPETGAHRRSDVLRSACTHRATCANIPGRTYACPQRLAPAVRQ